MNNTNSNIPHHYGDTKIVLMVRDPWTMFSYWEISPAFEENIKGIIAERGLTPLKSVLRIYEANSKEENVSHEFELKDWADSWYIHLDTAGKEWVADIGIMCTDGEFFRLARSNSVKTPPHAVSDVLDAEWMCISDLYGKMMSEDLGRSSMELKETIERYLHKWLSSGGVSSGFFSEETLSKGKKAE